MIKSSRTTTTKVSAAFLATVLIAGTIALSFPSFMIGSAQAQSDYGGMDNRYNSYGSDYGMDSYDDRKSYDKRSYGNDYGYESQYQPSYKPDYKPQYQSYDKKDDKRDKSKDSSKVDIKKIKCNNININLNAGTGNTTNGNTTNGNDNNGNKTDGFKKIDRDGFTFICINNNNNVAGGGGNVTDGDGVVPPRDECDRCFDPENEGGELPPERVIDLDEYFANPANISPLGNDPDVNSRAELCTAILQVAGTADEVTEEELRDFLNNALTPNLPEGQFQQVLECLGDLITLTE